MRLKSVTIKGFRPFKEKITIPIDDLTVFIGKNDAGKSSIIDALGIFFDCDTIKLDPNDCNIYLNEKVIDISCEFDNLPREINKLLVREHLLTKNKTLSIKKSYNLTSSRIKAEIFICAYYPVIDQYNDLLNLSLTQLKDIAKRRGIPQEEIVSSSAYQLRQAIWSSFPNLPMKEVEILINREDAKQIWEQLSRLLPVYAIFKSDRPSQDTDDEIQDPMKLAISAAIAEAKPELDRLIEIVKKKAEEIAINTQEQLKQINPQLASQLQPSFKSDPKWSSIFSIALNTDDGIPLNKRGSGVRRMVLLSFFRAEAERRKKEESQRNLIYAIEEPETSQHPAHQKLLLNALQKLSEEDGYQVLLTTHSPGFANMLPLKSLRYVSRSEHGDTLIEFGEEQVYQKIVDSLGVIPDTRVKVLVCVEGPTDVDNLKILSNILHKDDQEIPDLMNDPRIAVIPLGGSTLQYWVNENYLKELGIPEVHIYDGDSRNKYQKQVEKINQRQDGSWAVFMSKREIENYLHEDAIYQAFHVKINVGDNDDIPNILRQKCTSCSKNIKKEISQKAFPKMTVEMLRQRDPNDEVRGWLKRLSGML
jgi:putative ATP-dependent endonuclease of OLD family